jgi:hypothetical protein
LEKGYITTQVDEVVLSKKTKKSNEHKRAREMVAVEA